MRATFTPASSRRNPHAWVPPSCRKCTCATAPSYDRRPGMALLSVEHVARRFGGIVALDDVSLVLEQGQIGGLIGPNGAGKTTLFNVITRLYRPHGGGVVFDGRDLLHSRPHRIARLGIAR